MTNKSKRGFASMTEEKRKEIASRGGKNAHKSGNAHQWTPEVAAAAGHKGGSTTAEDREHMREIGRLGGLSKGKSDDSTIVESEG